MRVRGVASRACAGRGAACEPCHLGLRWSSLWGHKTCEGCVGMGMRWARGRMCSLPLGPSLRGHETCEGSTAMDMRWAGSRM
eukprot:2087329-Pyramimonas_sp.AAC.1